MYLLKPVRGSTIAGSFLFTFHYVSIKTLPCPDSSLSHIHLHSTMYLLKLAYKLLICAVPYIFTFHYVSIKTATKSHNISSCSTFTFHYVSIKTIMPPVVLTIIILTFTFHYVSIKTYLFK